MCEQCVKRTQYLNQEDGRVVDFRLTTAKGRFGVPAQPMGDCAGMRDRRLLVPRVDFIPCAWLMSAALVGSADAGFVG